MNEKKATVKATVTIKIDLEKWEEIKKIAKKRGISASAFVRQCAYACLEKERIAK